MAAALMLMWVAILGVIITGLLYLVAGFAIPLVLVGAIGLADRPRRRHQARSLDSSATAGSRTSANDAAIERDPAWRAAIEREQREHCELLTRWARAVERIEMILGSGGYMLSIESRAWQAKSMREAEHDRDTVHALLVARFDEAPSAGSIIYAISAGRSWEDLIAGYAYREPPRDRVLDVDRPFRTTTDCRYGHLDNHHIAYRDGDRITRECVTCEPATRWTEYV